MRTILLALILSLSLSLMGQFTGTLTNVVNGTVRTFKVFSDLENYRYEFEESGIKGVVIAFPGENKMWLLMPDEKYIHKTTADDFRMVSNDPVAGIKMYAAYGDVKKVGNEQVMGYDCDVTEYYQGETKIFTAWHASELNFIIKATNHMAEDSYMELTDINDWDADPSMFQEPEGYTEVDERMRPVIPEPEPPSSWTPVTQELPIDKTFERGIKLHFTVNYDKYTKVKFTNETESPAKVIYYQSVDGISLPEDEIGPLSYRTQRLLPGENKTLTFDLKQGQELTVEFHEGKMKMEAGPE